MPGVPPARFAYLGPAGTFTEAALRTLPAAARGDLYPMPTVAAALDAVRVGEVDSAVVPFENSVEGSVATTLDELATGDPLQVVREVPLLARPGTSLADVGSVATHPHAEAQCRRWLTRTLPEASMTLVSSTAEAARLVGQGVHDAAVSAPVAAGHYGLVPLVDGVQDNEGAVTRFVVVSRPGPLAPPSGADRSTLVAYIADDHPGALLEILTEFAVRGVNLTRIESRPTGMGLGRYCFSVDLEGHVADARVGEALSALKRVCADVRFLGSYPRADAVPPTSKPGTSDLDFTDAAGWLARIRAGSPS
jgi:prephenate dehydratase